MADLNLEPIDQDCEGDVVFVYETRRHPEVARCLLGAPPADLDSHKKWLRTSVPGKRLLFVAKVGGVPVGYCQAYGFEAGEVELGFVIHPDHQGKGYGGAMVDALVKTVKRMMPDKRVHLVVRAGNDKARRMYEKRGFRVVSSRMEL